MDRTSDGYQYHEVVKNVEKVGNSMEVIITIIRETGKKQTVIKPTSVFCLYEIKMSVLCFNGLNCRIYVNNEIRVKTSFKSLGSV